MSDNQSAGHLIVAGVSKAFGPNVVLNDIAMSIPRGELVTLLGPSGCGKTTLLRIVAGLTAPSSGSVTLAGKNITQLSPYKRNVGVVFQSYALFPHLSVAGNVGFGLKVRGAPRQEIDATVARSLKLVRLEHLAARAIGSLSGGQQQRVALARAIAVSPDILLFDEALSALDRKLRGEMQIELRRLLREIGATAIFVTHDQDEALTMSDRIAVMNGGRIEQFDVPKVVYERPASLFALGFVGLSTRISGTVAAVGNGRVEVETSAGRLAAMGHFPVGSRVLVTTRPENLRRTKEPNGNVVSGRIRTAVYQGSRVLIEVDAGQGETVFAELPPNEAGSTEVGSNITLSWSIDQTTAFVNAEAPS